MSVGKSVRLFLADGTPGGLLTAEIMNWTGHVIAAPRSELATLLNRSEVSRTGVYLLIGDNPATLGGTSTYIGEGDDVGARLRQHSKAEASGGKDFWERAIVLTSKDSNLTKAHARYLESRLIRIAQAAGRTSLINATAPPTPSLPEADVSDMDYFIAQARIVLPVLGINILRSAATPTTDPLGADTAMAPPTSSPTFTLNFRKEGIIATAQEIDGEFVVSKGSLARHAWAGSPGHGYRRLREQLEENQTLLPIAGDANMRFCRDQVFASPSAAAAVVLGRPANGRLDWKLPNGTTYGAWQQQGVDSPPDDTIDP